jgi:hypothetical protein
MDERKPSIVPDFMKKAIQGSVRSLVSSEEGIRAILREVLPKELVGYVKEVVDAAKVEGLRIVSAQTRDFLERLDVDALAAHLVENYRIRVRLDLELEPKHPKAAAPHADPPANGAPADEGDA